MHSLWQGEARPLTMFSKSKEIQCREHFWTPGGGPMGLSGEGKQSHQKHASQNHQHFCQFGAALWAVVLAGRGCF